MVATKYHSFAAAAFLSGRCQSHLPPSLPSLPSLFSVLGLPDTFPIIQREYYAADQMANEEHVKQMKELAKVREMAKQHWKQIRGDSFSRLTFQRPRAIGCSRMAF